MTPDFTQPHPDRRRAVVNECVLYLPWGISHVNGSWRVTVNNKQQYTRCLRKAWKNLQSRRPKHAVQEPGFHGPRKALDTGVIGLRISIYRRKENVYVAVKVAQSLARGQRAVMIGHCPLHELNLKWLDRMLRTGAGARWYYLAQRKLHGKPVDPINASNVPNEWIPSKPIQQITIDQVAAYIDKLSKVQT
jgi:hypothetical protein